MQPAHFLLLNMFSVMVHFLFVKECDRQFGHWVSLFMNLWKFAHYINWIKGMCCRPSECYTNMSEFVKFYIIVGALMAPKMHYMVSSPVGSELIPIQIGFIGPNFFNWLYIDLGI